MKYTLPALLGFILLITSCTKDSDSLSFEGVGYIGGEQYNDIEENPFVLVSTEPTSTFSIDADGGAYSNVRRFLNDGQLPPKEAVRTEELMNYFPMDYQQPTSNDPIGLNGEVSTCPWSSSHKLIRIGIQGKNIDIANRPGSNLVFLIDVSGSMNDDNKLPLLKTAFNLLVDELTIDDRVTIITYAGNNNILLDGVRGDEKTKLKDAINRLGSGGSTAGAEGIITAYEKAIQNFVEGGNNRVLLGTDGDFNVGPSSQEELISLIESRRDQGVFLTVLGVGTGNLNDGSLEQLANHGNGTYEYLDNPEQAKKVFIHEFQKLFTIAKDVKVQVTFNPDLVEQYRLIGYENRLLTNEEFTQDSVDAGEIGASQSITALYEIIPTSNNTLTTPTFTIDFRYKEPDSNISNPLTLSITDQGNTFTDATENMRFSASAAAFSLLLRDSQFKGTLTYDQIINWADNARNFDPQLYREEFVSLVKLAKDI